ADLADLHDAAAAVAEAADLHDHVDGARDLLADGLHGELDAGHEHHRLEAGHGVAGGVGVQRGQRPGVAGVHGLEHVERLATTALTDHDAVGPHAQGRAHQVADRDLAPALAVAWAGLHAHDVLLAHLELDDVLDRDDPVAVGDEAGQHVEQGRLARAGAAADQDVQLG